MMSASSFPQSRSFLLPPLPQSLLGRTSGQGKTGCTPGLPAHSPPFPRSPPDSGKLVLHTGLRGEGGRQGAGRAGAILRATPWSPTGGPGSMQGLGGIWGAGVRTSRPQSTWDRGPGAEDGGQQAVGVTGSHAPRAEGIQAAPTSCRCAAPGWPR